MGWFNHQPANHWNQPGHPGKAHSIPHEVGILMLIYWDICTEAVNLVYALDPKQSPGVGKFQKYVMIYLGVSKNRGKTPKMDGV